MLHEIIDSLTEPSKSLATPLLKTQVFSSRIGNDDLYNWVKNELDGYKANAALPHYRVVKAIIEGVMQQGMAYTELTSLPLSCFNDSAIEFLIKPKLFQGVHTLEGIASGQYGQYVVKPMAPDFCRMLTDQAKEKGCNFKVASGRTLIHIGEIVNTLSVIRGTLLDLLLKVESQHPDNDSLLKSGKKEGINDTINHIMTQINIHSTGQGNVITTGNNNNIEVNTHINKGDLQAFQQALKDSGISEEDIKEISNIVVEEEPSGAGLGARSLEWMTKMLGKAVNGSWQIGVSAAGGILEDALKGYFGI